MLAVMNQFTGVNGVMYYAYDILHDAGVPNVSCFQFSIVSCNMHYIIHFTSMS